MTVGLVALTAALEIAPQAASANNQPPLAWSFYVDVQNDSHGHDVMVTNGCNQASADHTANYNSLVIVDFGAMYDTGSDGTQLEIGGVPISQPNIEALVEDFIAGFAYCHQTHDLDLVIGTNNSRTLSTNNGAYFGGTSSAVANWVANAGFSSYLTVLGGNDIESWNNSSLTPQQAYNWHAGYAFVGAPAYVNFGSADNCPDNLSNTCTGTVWTQGDYYNLSGGFTDALVEPEIYNTAWAEQWAYISGFGAHVNGPLQPLGPIDGVNTNPSQAWSALNLFFPSSIIFATEMHYLT